MFIEEKWNYLGEIHWPVVVKQDEQTKILQETHNSNISAHSTETKTYNKIREYFYWPNLVDNVKEWVYSLVFIPFIFCNMLFSFSELIAKV